MNLMFKNVLNEVPIQEVSSKKHTKYHYINDIKDTGTNLRPPHIFNTLQIL